MSDQGPRHKKSKEPRRRTALDSETQISARELARQARRQRIRQRRRRVVFGAVVGIAVVGAAVGYTFIDRPDPEGPPAAVDVADSTGASGLLIVIDDGGRAATVALFASHPQERDRLMLFPPSLLTVQPGFGEHQLADALVIGDENLASLSITNLLGIRIDDVLVVDLPTLEAAIQEPLEVDLAEPFLVDEGDVQRVAAAAGSEPRTPQLIFELLTDRGTGTESDLLLRQGRVWDALLESVSDDTDMLDRLIAGRSESLRVAFAGVAQDEERIVAALPVITAESVGGAGSQVIFDTATTADFVAGAFPYLQIAEEPRSVLELLNGNGGVGVTQPVAERLVSEGYRVLKTDNADRTDFAVSQVVAHGRENEQTALAIQRLLGTGDVVLELRQPSAVFDVTIIVGNDLAPNGS